MSYRGCYIFKFQSYIFVRDNYVVINYYRSASAPVIVDYNIVIPNENVRLKFENITTSIRHLLNNLLDKNAKLRTIRDLLLPNLVSGELDVSELDIYGVE